MKQKKLVLVYFGVLFSLISWSQAENLEVIQQQDTTVTCVESVVIAENYFRGVDTFLRNPEKGLDYLMPCVNEEYSNAQHLFGLIHLGAYGVVPTNYNVAFEYIEKAALQGNPDAMCNLAILYQMGRGCKIDFDKAIEIYDEAFELGSTKSAYKLGYMYFKGLGSIDQDYEKAVEWFKKSGYPFADFFLGVCYYYGYGVEVDKNRALDVLKASSRPGCQRLYTMLIEGKGIIKLQDNSSNLIESLENSQEEDSIDIENIIEAEAIEEEEAFDINSVTGNWEGKLVEFDWSNTKLLRSIPVKVTLGYNETINKVDYTLDLLGKKSSESAILLEKSLSFNNLQMNLERLYKDDMGYDILNYKIVSADISKKSVVGSNYLVIDIETQVTNWQEPGPPMKLILQRKTNLTANGEEISDELLQLLGSNKDGFISLYPNPFVEDLLIEYELKEASNVSVEVYNYLDQSRITLEAGKLQQPDKYIYHLDGYDMKSGLYIVKVIANSQVHTKMIVKGN